MTEPGEHAGPVQWMALTPDEAPEEWESLRAWVIELLERFPAFTRLPECWWRHNDFVEVLSALRDYERACFGRSAPLSGPVDWQRALRDLESRLEIWTKRLNCAVPGRGHAIEPRDAGAAWAAHIDRDVARRRLRQASEHSNST